MLRIFAKHVVNVQTVVSVNKTKKEVMSMAAKKKAAAKPKAGAKKKGKK